MCGICGQFNFCEDRPVDLELLKKMVLIMRYRGPDECGIYKNKNIGLGHTRLSVIDLEAGLQPVHNEDKSIWITYNGEVFNYLELRNQLIAEGHRFYTKTDTEVIAHLYEKKGLEMFKDLNGQFAFCIFDKEKNILSTQPLSAIL